jgi:hypothetical protein
LGPSPIKSAEEHGFGLGIFTGRPIKEGTPIEPTFFGHGEILLPHFGSDDIYNKHPPLREYIWEEDNMPEIAVEYPDALTALFIPGIAAIAPCTSQNFNLQIAGRGSESDKPRWSAVTDEHDVHRSTDPQAGAFSYRHNVTYVAVRDIAPGEELTIQCSDSNYDGGAYYLSRYTPEDNSVVCLDHNIRVAKTTSDEAKGMGVFAKRDMKMDTIITSTPLIPIERNTMKIWDFDKDPVNDQQLMLNYQFGHPGSDLLFLPTGPMVNFINHNQIAPNAEIRWHKVKEQHQEERSLQRREEYHHPELFDMPAATVMLAHGKGLMMDIVATRDIAQGEEIFLNYGHFWQAAWDKHKEDYKKTIAKFNEKDRDYVSAQSYRELNGEDEFKTLMEQSMDPYPNSLKFHCFYQQHDAEHDKQNDAYRKEMNNGRGWRRFSWNDHDEHPCFRPCNIIERYTEEDEDEPRYTVEMFKSDNIHVMYYCGISMDYRYTDVPHSDIRLLDAPYTPDMFQRWAFRHEIGVPEGFYPESWMKKKLRQRGNAAGEASGIEFRTKSSEVPQKAA